MTLKTTLIKNFSRCPHLYDRYADIQQFVARKLAQELPGTGVRSILELGCGTGIYTESLRHRFKKSRILALDISQGMINFARKKLDDKKIEFVTADAEEKLKGNFDLVTANAFFQWISDAKMAIKNYKKILSKDGVLLFSAFGPETYRELKSIVKIVSDTKSSLGSDEFLAKDDWRGLLNKYFRCVKIKETVVKVIYSSLHELLRVIKYTGTRGCPAKEFSWDKLRLNQAERLYKERFGRIIATYQIFICKAM